VTLIAAGTIVLDGRICRPGWVRTRGARILDCAPGPAPAAADVDVPDAVVVPGFVDMHSHGGGGASFTEDTPRAAAFHRQHGTTTTLASTVTAAPDGLLAAVHTLAEATRSDMIAGIHLEGPWLSPRHRGAHDRGLLRDPDVGEIDALLAAGGGAIRMVTLAPERPGSHEAIARFIDAGAVVAVGHTNASYEQTRQAIVAGATVGTHLFNAMPPLHHREPGPVLALLDSQQVTVEMIADGVHLHPAVLRAVITAVGPDRVALVTDAMPAAGLGDGAFRLGPVDVDVVSGVARVRDTSTIAGSAVTMDRIFGTAAALAEDPDAGLLAAVRMTSTTPARVLGFDDVGHLRAGLRADLVVLENGSRIAAVMSGGEWMVGAFAG
jgi:N-acetylglucosamine-6-phosphate deacetylase